MWSVSELASVVSHEAKCRYISHITGGKVPVQVVYKTGACISIRQWGRQVHVREQGGRCQYIHTSVTYGQVGGKTGTYRGARWQVPVHPHTVCLAIRPIPSLLVFKLANLVISLTACCVAL